MTQYHNVNFSFAWMFLSEWCTSSASWCSTACTVKRLRTSWNCATSHWCCITATSLIHHQQLLVVPCHQLSSYGRRAFCLAGLSVWNSLPDGMRNPIIGRNSFRQSPKTFLFATYWCIQRIGGFMTMHYINRLFTYLHTSSKSGHKTFVLSTIDIVDGHEEMYIICVTGRCSAASVSSWWGVVPRWSLCWRCDVDMWDTLHRQQLWPMYTFLTTYRHLQRVGPKGHRPLKCWMGGARVGLEVHRPPKCWMGGARVGLEVHRPPKCWMGGARGRGQRFTDHLSVGWAC